jgi:hypothetical protein
MNKKNSNISEYDNIEHHKSKTINIMYGEIGGSELTWNLFFN